MRAHEISETLKWCINPSSSLLLTIGKAVFWGGLHPPKISGSRHGMNPKFSPEVVPNKRGSRAKFQVKMVAGVYFTDQNRIFKKI